MDLFSNPPPRKVYVLAWNYRIARDWAARNGLGPRDIVYVADVPTLRGARDILVYFHETWWNHPSAWRFKDLLATIDYEVYIPESLES